jgi:hypothetical protein
MSKLCFFSFLWEGRVWGGGALVNCLSEPGEKTRNQGKKFDLKGTNHEMSSISAVLFSKSFTESKVCCKISFIKFVFRQHCIVHSVEAI